MKLVRELVQSIGMPVLEWCCKRVDALLDEEEEEGESEGRRETELAEQGRRRPVHG